MLRHPFGPFTVDVVDRSKEPDVPVPRLPPPFGVSYRRDGDVSRLVAAVKQNHRVSISAAVGAGKSTRIPALLADSLGMLVVHTIPFRHAARYLQEYLRTLPNGDKFIFMDDITADIPTRGVVLMTNTYFLARMFTDRFASCPDFLLYMDENHESDSATAVLREVATSFSCVRHVVFATATKDPGSDLTPVLPGKRVMQTYKPVPVNQWSAFDVGKPWSAGVIDHNAVIFIDRETTARSLMADYRASGFDAYRLTSRSSDQEFADAMVALKNERGPVTVVLVDYAYRSSFTLPRVKIIIDSAEVALPTVKDNAPTVMYRDAYDFEIQQALGRGGRIDTDTVKLYKPEGRALTRMCDLESLEGDAASLMYRMLGFMPPKTCHIFDETQGPVPIDLVGALQGDTPLKLYPPESREPWIKEGVVKSVKVDNTVAPYAFRATAGIRPRPASCRTVKEPPVVRSASPPLNHATRETVLDSEAYADYVSNRSSSPQSGPIRTLSTRSSDNLSVMLDDDSPIFAKPKRVAQRVLDAQKAQESKPLPAPPEPVLAQEPSAESEAEKLANQVLDVQQHAGQAFNALAKSATQVKKRMEHDKSGHLTDSAPFKEMLTRTARQRAVQVHDSGGVGQYYYYHGMSEAPAESTYFVAGYENIKAYCHSENAEQYRDILPERDKLFAITLLLQKYNVAIARTHGIQRLIEELQQRPDEQFKNLLDPAALSRELLSVVEQYNEAKAESALMFKYLKIFLDRPLDAMPPLVNLENKVMREVLARFEYAAIVKDPTHQEEYFNRMNSQAVKMLRTPTRKR